VGVSLGAALGTFILPLRVAVKGGLRLQLVWRHPLMGKFILTALPLMLGQTIMMLDEQFLRVFGSLAGDGAVSLLNYGRRIAQVPVGLMGQAAAVASYPFLVSLLAQGRSRQFDQTLNTALRTSLGLIIPCALCMIATAWPILAIIFQGGRFGAAETLATVPLTQIMLAATPLWIVYMVLVRAYYAHSDTLTPAVTGTLMTLFCLPVYYYWAAPRGAWAIATVSSVSVSLYVIWLICIWVRRKGSKALAGLPALGLRALCCSLPGSLAAWLLSEYIRCNIALAPLLTAALALMLGGAAFALFFVPLAWRFAPETLAPLLQRLRKTDSPAGGQN
jgi:putative peptidoglycan lipid II flippase